MSAEIYYDNSATTRTRTASAELVTEMLTQCYGNPSSLHRKGFEAQKCLDLARKQIADTLGCQNSEITFTSGGTESDNLAILGAAAAQKRRGNKIITTLIEHDAVLQAVKFLEGSGWNIVRLKPDSNGIISPDQITAELDGQTVLVSVMAVNNEIGSVLPIGEICKEVRRKDPDVLIHCDAVQAYCKQPIKIGRQFDVDFLSVSGHKIYAPKGIGALYVKKGSRIRPTSFGGGQEKGLRPGTESIALACAMGLSAELTSQEIQRNHQQVAQIKAAILSGLAKFSCVRIHSATQTTPYILNLSVLGVRSEIMLHFLEEKNIFVSSGSACAKGEASHVLAAIGLNRAEADSTLRLSFGRYNNLEQVPVFLAALEEGINRFGAKR